MNRSGIRVLLVEDFLPYRALLATLLERNPNVSVIGEASDGLEAVVKAQALEPDLILMDIGLPKLNGLEAAKRIREFAPSSSIVFVTQESAPEIVKEALNQGASGFIAKQDVAANLPAAIAAILRGRRFVSSGLLEDELTPTKVPCGPADDRQCE